MKKILITIMLSMFFVGLYCTSAYASEYENKYWGVVGGNYVRYGHIIINGTDFQVYMTLIDNGISQKFVPLIYSESEQTITLVAKGNHTPGTTLDKAKSLTDYYNDKRNLNRIQLVNINNEPSGYFYYSNTTITEYVESSYIEFETNTPKYYYFEDGCDLNSTDTYIKALNKMLYGGGLSDFTVSDGSISKVSNYTLEPPLNVQVNNYQPKKVLITWEQSENVNVSDWYTEFYFQQQGTVKKTLFSTKKKFDTDFIYYDKILNHYQKYTFNSLALDTTDKFLIDFIDNNGHVPQVSEIDKTNIMMRNVYDDGNGNIYYSNYVYLYQDDHYKYIANEVNGEDMDKDGMSSSNIDSNIKTDSDIYDNADIGNIGNSSLSSGNALTVMRGLLNSLKDFPKFMYEFFTFMPEEIYIAISAFLLLMIPIALIKIVI